MNERYLLVLVGGIG